MILAARAAVDVDSLTVIGFMRICSSLTVMPTPAFKPMTKTSPLIILSVNEKLPVS